MEHKLDKVFLLSTEEPGDYIYTLAGVVTVWDNQQFNVFCLSSDHNLFRAALLRHPWADLEEGITYREVQFRLSDITEEMQRHDWTTVADIPNIIRHLYDSNRKHLYFLRKHVEIE